MIKIKRVYEQPEDDDGLRYLVDRLWPRGIKKENLKADGWLKELAPSTGLRKWYHREMDNFEEFRVRYFKELDSKPDLWDELLKVSQKSNLTLLYASRDTEHNHARVLKEFLESRH